MILETPPQRHYDFAIIGSGPAGITTALALGQASGRRIALIESGGLTASATAQDLARVELHGDLSDGYFPMHTQRCFGGSSTIWGGFCAVLEERAFLAGEWPIPFATLSRWYPDAAAILELPANASHRASVAIPDSDTLVYKPFFLSPPVRFNRKFHEPIANHTGIDLVLNATCTRLLHRRGHATALELRSTSAPETPAMRLTADRFILACGGIGNPRLLQLSGLGDDLPVGVGLMDHPHLYAVAHMYLDWPRLQPVIDEGERVVHALQLADDYCVEQGLISLSADFNRVQVTSEPLLGRRREALLTPVSLRAELPPHPFNRVSDSDQHNALGQPRPRVDFHFAFDELARTTWNHFARALLHSGLGRPSLLAPTFRIHGGGHLMGTTRMGLSPDTSVVDRHCRVHTTDNVYVAGSSVFPAGGASNPTFTIVALALRLADHLLGGIQHG
ncbi:GMC oxidoreductase [Marinobacter sp. JSM 1782161]|uniref:GMC oxidoreductase n=1 Tax=Marinobacter sp. JSM 1782161 TaxID=2685906 RepID=UPI0014034016|nr:GMC oxidoreductase [Marinobacter sp. JSM 1782161]